MNTNDFLLSVRKVLTDAGKQNVLIRRLSELDKREGVCVRSSTERVCNAYIDGSSDMELPLRIFCKRRAASDALTDAEDIADILDGMVLLVGSEVVVIERGESTTQEVELNDSGFYTWEVNMTCYYTEKGRIYEAYA